MAATQSVERLCGDLIVGGFDSSELPAPYADALQRGRRAGAILFRRNLPSCAAAWDLCSQIARAGALEPPLIAVDQEGGRVARLAAPVVELPPMRRLGELGDWAFVEDLAWLLGLQLRALGFNVDFAPVLDVDSNPANPVIGDRSFGRETPLVVQGGRSFAHGLARAGIVACGKHFPGHGDTALDSHVALPTVHHPRSRLDQVELQPFRELAPLLPSLMTAHVVYPALDPAVPATLSKTILNDLGRHDLGFRGVFFSDDLEMAAVAARYPIGELAVLGVAAGCDVLLVCHGWEAQELALEGLIREAEQSVAFRARCAEARQRVLALRRTHAPAPALDPEEVQRIGERPLAQALRARLAELR